MNPAARTEQVTPFYVMEVVKRAGELSAGGRSILHLSIGEPDFPTPGPIRAAAERAINAGTTGYTPALGLPALREAIAGNYRERFDIEVDPRRVVVTAGASAALLLAFAALLDPGREVLLPEPSYPCNANFAAAFGGIARFLPCAPTEDFQPTPAQVDAAWSERTAALLLAAPANPTGTSIGAERLAALAATVNSRGGALLVDEIYGELVYGRSPRTALELTSDLVVLNSFSKYYCMTGWRLGWMVVPEALIPALERLAQNLFICASAVAQHAALACFTPATRAECEARREEFARRRARLLPALRALGFGIPAEPDGAFYVYADVSGLTADSWQFCFDLLEQTGVCIVPGRDFGPSAARQFVRFSYAASMSVIDQALDRIAAFLAARRAVAA